MADKEPALWQARYVADGGPTTIVTDGLFGDAPLRAVASNLPPGSNVGTSDNPLIVSGPYIKLRFSVPNDGDGDNLGAVRIYRSSRKFSRDILDATMPAEPDDTAVCVYEASILDELVLARGEYRDALTIIDQPVSPGSLWYYTLFFSYEIDGVTGWAYDRAGSHCRAWAYEQHDRDGEPYSPMGDELFNALPRYYRVLDSRDADNASYRLCQITGRLLDQVKEEIDVLKTRRFDVDEMDFEELSYVDWLLAWPTNFELDESRRRRETQQAADLWKSKGLFRSIELALQTVTGWDVQVTEGWPWAAETYDGRGLLDPDSPPSDWVEGTDGVWADLVSAQPTVTETFSSDPLYRANTGVLGDMKTYTFSTRKYVENAGVGWHWQNPNGLLITMGPVDAVAARLTATIVAKVAKLAPMFALHYAAFVVAVQVADDEEFQPLGEDYFSLEIDGLTEEELTIEDSGFVDSVGAVTLLYTWPHPGYPGGSRSNNPEYITLHSTLIYSGDFLEDLEMPQFVHFASGETVSQTIPEAAVGHMTFDPTAYAGDRVFRFAAIGFIGGPTPTLSIQVDLWDLDNDESVSTLAINATSAERTISGVLDVGSSSGELKDALTRYEVRISLENVSDPADFGYVGNVYIEVE